MVRIWSSVDIHLLMKLCVSQPSTIREVGQQVAETCQLALQRIERCRDGAVAAADEASPYLSVDPMQVCQLSC